MNMPASAPVVSPKPLSKSPKSGRLEQIYGSLSNPNFWNSQELRDAYKKACGK